MLRLFGFVFLVALISSSCEIINPNEDVPAYIHIDSIALSTQAQEGTNSNKITDAWVYIDGQTIGAFELPATIPILMSGKHQIDIRPGIKINGIGATRAIYPFFKPFIAEIDLTAKATTKLSPTTSYYDGIIFDFIEAFEPPGTIFERTTNSDTSIMLENKECTPMNNGSYGKICIDSLHPIFEFSTIKTFSLPKTGKPAFIELDYKCNTPFIVGVIINRSNGSSETHPVIVVNNAASWNKIYVNLSELIQREQSATSYKVFIGSQTQTSIGAGTIYLDNIKLIHGN